MASKIKNIIIFVIIATVFILIYIFFIKPKPSQDNLISAPNTLLPNIDNSSSDPSAMNVNSLVAKDFLALLLNVKNIKLNDAILSDPSFNGLHDSTITLIPDGTEGRPNPFAQFGNDAVAIIPATCVLPQVLDVLTNTCIAPPPPTCKLPKILNTSTNTCVNPAPLN